MSSGTCGIKYKKYIPAVIACAFVYSASNTFFRPVWFDEAITIMDFTAKLNLLEAYRQYNIPNNHIVYTWALKVFMSLYEKIFPVTDFSFRIPSLIAGVASIFLLYRMITKSNGTTTAFLISMLFTLSFPFSLYTTAVRGYMLSCVFILAALYFCSVYLEKGRLSAGVIYFFCSVLTVGTIPSNIAALAMGSFFLSAVSGHCLFSRKTLTVICVPFVALVVFYLPIYGKLLANFKLKEGCSSAIYAFLAVYLSFLLAFLPLVVLLLPWIKKHCCISTELRHAIAGTFIFLVPLFIIILFRPAPFPRIFFSFWPLWLLAMAPAVSFSMKKLCLAMPSFIFVFIILLSVGWAYSENFFRNALSDSLTPENTLDDYFSPYYTRDNFNPLKTAIFIKESRKPVYITFDADPYSITFYASFLEIHHSMLLFDNPKRKTVSLPPGCLIIVRNKADLDKTLKRFGIKMPLPLNTEEYQKIYVRNLEGQ